MGCSTIVWRARCWPAPAPAAPGRRVGCKRVTAIPPWDLEVVADPGQHRKSPPRRRPLRALRAAHVAASIEPSRRRRQIHLVVTRGSHHAFQVADRGPDRACAARSARTSGACGLRGSPVGALEDRHGFTLHARGTKTGGRWVLTVSHVPLDAVGQPRHRARPRPMVAPAR